MASSQSGDERRKSKGSRRKSNGGGARADHVYCFCREPQRGRFMIACDSCDEWYHGTCVGITKGEGDGIECYYCDTCTAATPNLKIIYKEDKEPDTKGRDPNAVPQRCMDCMVCCTQPDCGTCSRCKAKNGRCLKVVCLNTKAQDDTHIFRKPYPPPSPKDESKDVFRKPYPPLAPKDEPKTEPKVELKVEEKPEPKPEPKEEEIDETYSLPSTSRMAGGGGVAGSAKRGRKKGWRADKGKGGAKGGDKDKQKTGNEPGLVDRMVVGSEAYKAHMQKERKDFVSKRGPVQCHGVGCVFESRRDSKYCSDACGMSRAKERLSMYLPKAVENYWKMEPAAVKQSRKEAISNEQLKEKLNKEKAELDKWHGLLIDYVQALKPFFPEEKEDGKADGDFVVPCPVCTVEFGCKVIGRHIEKCNARSEKQTTYGTSAKCILNPNGMICDQFNKSNNSYCKRLRVICPEHYKGDIEEGVEVCGHPRAWNKAESTTLDGLFTSVDGMLSEGFCGVARKDCKKHNGWIAMMLGLIDNRRLTYFQKMDELVEKKTVKTGDALLLMTNQTEYHQPLEKILDKYEKGAKRGGETVMGTLL